MRWVEILLNRWLHATSDILFPVSFATHILASPEILLRGARMLATALLLIAFQSPQPPKAVRDWQAKIETQIGQTWMQIFALERKLEIMKRDEQPSNRIEETQRRIDKANQDLITLHHRLDIYRARDSEKVRKRVQHPPRPPGLGTSRSTP